MPRKTKIKSKKRIPSVSSIKSNPRLQEPFFQSIHRRIKLDESYVSLALGVLVVVILVVILGLVVGGKGMASDMKVKSKPVAKTSVTQAPQQKIYTVQEGEGIWDVAVKFYGDGFRWTDIAKVNDLDEYSANFLSPGTKLIIP